MFVLLLKAGLLVEQQISVEEYKQESVISGKKQTILMSQIFITALCIFTYSENEGQAWQIVAIVNWVLHLIWFHIVFINRNYNMIFSTLCGIEVQTIEQMIKNEMIMTDVWEHHYPNCVRPA